MTRPKHWIADIQLADRGARAVQEALLDMPGLVAISNTYATQKPLTGIRITGCVSVTYETAALITVLQSLGADLRWCSDNRFASLDDACAYIARLGVPIFAKRGESLKEYYWCFEQAIHFSKPRGPIRNPDYIIDDGCDLSGYLHTHHPDVIASVRGVSEQTTCGITSFIRLFNEEKLRCPVMDINDSRTKNLFDNCYGSRESFIQGLQRSINRQLAGTNVVIFGYGQVGKGCAQALRGLGAHIHICEAHPIAAMEATMDGFPVLGRAEACAVGQLFVTATGCIKTLDQQDFNLMKNGAVLMNMGHGNMEINTDYLYHQQSIRRQRLSAYEEKFTLPNGRHICLLGEGYLLNFWAGEGHPPRAMSVTFTNHILALIEFVQHGERYAKKEIYPLPDYLDAQTAWLNIPDLQDKLIRLSDEQMKYLGLSPDDVISVKEQEVIRKND